MPRTTIDLDQSVLTELKARAEHEGTTLGDLASQLLARALGAPVDDTKPSFSWTTGDMRARVDLEDKEAVARLLDT